MTGDTVERIVPDDVSKAAAATAVVSYLAAEMPRACRDRFERWRPLRRFAAALDRPVGGTFVEDVVP